MKYFVACLLLGLLYLMLCIFVTSVKSKGVYNGTYSVAESKKEGVFVVSINENIEFEGRFAGSSYETAWIEADRDLKFVFTVIPFKKDYEIWSNTGGFFMKVVGCSSLFYGNDTEKIAIVDSKGRRALRYRSGRGGRDRRIDAFYIDKSAEWEAFRIIFSE